MRSARLLCVLVVGCGASSPGEPHPADAGEHDGSSPIDASPPSPSDAAHDGAVSPTDAWVPCTPIETWELVSSVVVPGEALVLVAPSPVDVSRLRATFDARIELTLSLIDTFAVGAVVPDLEPGRHVLTIEACSGTSTIDLEVEAAPAMEDPEATIAEVISLLRLRLMSLTVSADSLSSMLSDAERQIAEADEADRRAIAQMIAANRQLFERTSPLCADESCDRRVGCLRSRTVSFVARLALLGTLAFFTPPPMNLIPLVGIGVVLLEFADENGTAVYQGCVQALQDELAFSLPIEDGGGSEPAIGERVSDLGVVSSGEPLTLALSARYAPLSGADLTDASIVEDLSRAANRSLQIWQRVVDVLASFGRSLGTPSPTLGTESRLDLVDLSMTQFELVDAPGVSLDVTAEGDNVRLTFSIVGDGPIEGQLRLTYDNPDVMTFEQLVPFVVARWACGGDLQRCCSDGSCTGSRTCVEGFCRSTYFDAHPCSTASDCGTASSRHCNIEGFCVYSADFRTHPVRCESDASCGSGSLCLADGFCARVSTCECGTARCGRTPSGTCYQSLSAPCVSDSNCGSELRCLSGRCRSPTDVGYPCSDTSRCHGTECIGGQCSSLDAGGGWWCGDDDLCREGTECVGGVCRRPVACGTCFGSSTCSPYLGCRLPCGHISCNSGCLDGFCSSEDGASCSNDSECNSGFCRRGTCRTPGRPGATCVTSEDCGGIPCGPTGRCQTGRVNDPCRVDDECNDVDRYSGDHPTIGLTCGPNGRCQFGTGGDACTVDLDCRVGGLRCGGGRCSFGTAGSTCDEDADCPLSGACGPDGVCQGGSAGELCVDDSDCFSFNACVGSVCFQGEPGDPCLEHADCRGSASTETESSGICGPDGQCQRGEGGDPCLDQSQCGGTATSYSDFDCILGTCVPVRP